MPIYTVTSTAEIIYSTEIEAPDKATALKLAEGNSIEWDSGYDINNWVLCKEDEVYCEEDEE